MRAPNLHLPHLHHTHRRGDERFRIPHLKAQADPWPLVLLALVAAMILAFLWMSADATPAMVDYLPI